MKPQHTEIISIREFARRVGAGATTIRHHIQAGHFTKGSTIDDKGRPKMVWPTAEDEWKVCGGASTVKGPVSGNMGDDEIPAYAESRAATEYYKSQIAKIELDEKQGLYVKKEDVYKALYESASNLRSAILSVPKLVVDDVMACTDRGEAIELIYKALETQLLRMVDEDVLDSKDGPNDAVEQ